MRTPKTFKALIESVYQKTAIFSLLIIIEWLLLGTGYPLFPGENEVEQLACMMEVLGVPVNSVLEHATRKKMFFGMSIKHELQLLS